MGIANFWRWLHQATPMRKMQMFCSPTMVLSLGPQRCRLLKPFELPHFFSDYDLFYVYTYRIICGDLSKPFDVVWVPMPIGCEGWVFNHIFLVLGIIWLMTLRHLYNFYVPCIFSGWGAIRPDEGAGKTAIWTQIWWGFYSGTSKKWRVNCVLVMLSGIVVLDWSANAELYDTWSLTCSYWNRCVRFVIALPSCTGWFAWIMYNGTSPSEPGSPSGPTAAASSWYWHRDIPENSVDDRCCYGDQSDRPSHRHTREAHLWASLRQIGSPPVAPHHQSIR